MHNFLVGEDFRGSHLRAALVLWSTNAKALILYVAVALGIVRKIEVSDCRYAYFDG